MDDPVAPLCQRPRAHCPRHGNSLRPHIRRQGRGRVCHSASCSCRRSRRSRRSRERCIVALLAPRTCCVGVVKPWGRPIPRPSATSSTSEGRKARKTISGRCSAEVGLTKAALFGSGGVPDRIRALCGESRPEWEK